MFQVLLEERFKLKYRWESLAVEEESGLKLKRSKGPVEVLVVERVERPTEN